jgi:hypothetical protein
MGIGRLVRLTAAGLWMSMVVAAHAADAGRACGADNAPCATDVATQATALVVPHANEFVRTAAAPLRAAAVDGMSDATDGARIGDPATRADSETVEMAELEIYALVGAILVAVLSLSRRRNL